MKLFHYLVSSCALAAALPAPARAQCSTDTPLPVVRQQQTSVVLGDLVFIAGGTTGLTTFYDRVDVYDSATDTWSVATLSVPRIGMGATAVGNRVLFAGGYDGAPSDVVDVYDAALGPPSDSGAWSTTTLSLPRFNPSATTVGGKAIFAGGAIAGNVYKRVDIYDSAMGDPSDSAAWSHGPLLGQARSGVTAATVGNLAIFAGGSGVGGVPYADVDIYDDSTGTWTWNANGLSQARLLGRNAAAVVGTRVYFAGGHNSQGGGPTMYDTVDIFDAQSGVWDTAALSVPRGYIGATAIGNTIFFAGGRLTGNVYTDLVETFSVGTQTWCTTCPLTEARTAACAETVGGKAMLAAGFGVNGASPVVDVHEPVGVSYCISAANSTGAAAGISATGSSSVLANDLVLTACNMPDQPGIFVAGPAAGQLPYLNGFLCIDPNGLQRFANANFATGGLVVEPVDLATSAPGGLNVVAGSSYFYQRWYRDPAAGGGNANFSDAIEVAYTP